MTGRKNLIKTEKTFSISWFDFIVIAIIILGGAYYLHDVRYWSVGYVGDAPYGDAQFWWSGAVNFAQGIFQDNPGKGFRPGYFILSGLTLPILGMQFQNFFPFFLAAFLVVASFFYLALRFSLGRWTAACVVGLLVLNPFTAEWIATSTTDSTGLLLDLAALGCLLFGVRDGLDMKWLAAFGLFFALANLTRPLMLPFIGFVTLLFLFSSKEKLGKRLWVISAMLLAFCAPMLLWMGAQKLIINQWSISSNDASAFYAASDPKIQVWNNEMYEQIRHLAQDRNKGTVDERLINHTFWTETLHNYVQHFKYHVQRIYPNIFQVANFSPKMATHGADSWRITLLMMVGIGLAFRCVQDRRMFCAVSLLILSSSMFFWPENVPYVLLAGVVVAFLPNQENRLSLYLLSGYWLAGVFGLYLIGGIWGPPSQPVCAINALGYRLGTQVFFMGDLLIAYLLLWLSGFTYQHALNKSHISWANKPAPLANYIVSAMFVIFIVGATGVYIGGSMLVAQRAYARSHVPSFSYPDLTALQKYYSHLTQHRVDIAHPLNGGFDAKTNEKIAQASHDWVLFSAGVSPFVWNFQGQDRAQLMVHTQDKVHPFKMGPGFVILEVPQHLVAKDWSGVQGAFLVQIISNKHNDGNIPYYLTVPAVRAFIPLATDKKHYDLSHAIWFPLSINATQLASSDALEFKNTKVTWAQNSGIEKYKRRLFLTPTSSDNIEMALDVSGIRKPAILSFSYESASIPGEPQLSQGDYIFKVSAIDQTNKTQEMLVNHETIQKNNTALSQVNLKIPAQAKAMVISFNKLSPKTGIWLYEFNTNTADFSVLKHLSSRN